MWKNSSISVPRFLDSECASLYMTQMLPSSIVIANPYQFPLPCRIVCIGRGFRIVACRSPARGWHLLLRLLLLRGFFSVYVPLEFRRVLFYLQSCGSHREIALLDFMFQLLGEQI